MKKKKDWQTKEKKRHFKQRDNYSKGGDKRKTIYVFGQEH